MKSWHLLVVVGFGSVWACSLNAAGELAVDAGLADGPLVGLGFDGGGPATGRDATGAMKDATAPEDAKKDAGTKPKDASVDAATPPDGVAAKEAGPGGDGAGADARAESGEPTDAEPDVADAGGAGDGGSDGGSAEAGVDAGAPDAATDAGGGVDAAAPPNSCFFGYACGSNTCGCNQRCDDGATCGACSPHFGTCTLDLHACDSDFSSATSCGGCGNFCCGGLGTCSLSGGVYECDPCF